MMSNSKGILIIDVDATAWQTTPAGRLGQRTPVELALVERGREPIQ